MKFNRIITTDRKGRECKTSSVLFCVKTDLLKDVPAVIAELMSSAPFGYNTKTPNFKVFQ